MNDYVRQLNWPCLLWVGFLTVVMGFAAKQISAQTYVSQDGRLLEANSRLGSFGYNTSADLNPLVPRVNDYITGNVTGGRSFQGSIPYSSTGEFQSNLGSSTLNTFRRDSISRSDLAFGVIQPQRFLDSSRQVTSIYNGTVRSSGTTGAVYQSPVSSTYQPGQSSRVLGRDMSANPLTTSASYNTLNVSGGHFGLSGQPPVSARLFGTQVDQRYLDSLSNRDRFVREEAILQTPDQPETKQPQDGQAVEDMSEAEFGGFERAVEPTAFESSMQQQAAERAIVAEQTGQATEDMEGEQGDRVGQVRSAEKTGAVTPSYSREEFQEHQSSVRRQALQRHDERLQQGMDLLKMGKYYDAANVFDTALAFVPQSAPACLGKAHALLGAGEFMSASHFLLRALQIDPRVVQNGPALAEVFPPGDVLNKRIAELDRWHERSEQPMLLVLRGYVEYRTGQMSQAENSLQECLGSQPNFGPVESLLEAVRQASAADNNNG